MSENILKESNFVCNNGYINLVIESAKTENLKCSKIMFTNDQALFEIVQMTEDTFNHS